MPEAVKARRAYHSPRRAAQAQATRRAILDAARDLFVEQGFVATTVDAVADRAGISVETVYAAFGSKRALLAELLDVSIGGGDTTPPILDQAWVEELRDAPDPHSRVRLLAHHGRLILERRSALDEVVHGATTADAEIGVLWQRLKSERSAGQRELLRLVIGDASLRDGLDLETGTAILYAIGSPETYRLLVVDQGWTASQFETWYRDALTRLLF